MTNAKNTHDSVENAFEGIWQFARSAPAVTPDGAHLTNHFTFICDTDTVIVRLISISTLQNHSGDDIYRLKARWNANTLYYLPPFGKQWAELATFDGDHFIAEGDNEHWDYRKIAPAEIAEWNKDMLKPDILLHAYSP